MMGREHEVAEMRAEARHANERLALYRRRMNLGRGEQTRMVELERIAAGANQRLRDAERRADARRHGDADG
jgi:hypothetical protein